ncbi:MAG: hypothetical protein JOY99_14705 [Sphingomonadaceae bacterium]|nr:hypothetical protein [Sphingomonadaceae bacterium]
MLSAAAHSEADAEFALERLMDDQAIGRAGDDDVRRMLTALRLSGDVHRLERLSRLLRAGTR